MTEQEGQEAVTTETNGEEKNKNENDVEQDTARDNAIIRQLEYYFGDTNLPRDRFLRDQVKLDDGWVPFDVLTTFNRLAKISKDITVIANAIKNSTSGLLEVSDDDLKVRRNPENPLPEMNEERRKELMSRTAYAKGFPKNSNLDEILKFLKDHKETENVIMRKYLDRTKKRLFKGSVFVTFKTKEQAEKFVNSKGLKYGDTELLLLWQEDYVKQKQEEFATKKEKKEKKNKSETKPDTKSGIKLASGAVLHFSHNDEKLTREKVKEALTPLGAEITFIEFKCGDTVGWVRMTQEDSAKTVFDKMTDGKLKIDETEVTFRVLEGDEEKAYLEKTAESILKRRQDSKQNRHKGKSFGFKGKHGKQGRKRKYEGQRDNDEPQDKVKADDS